MSGSARWSIPALVFVAACAFDSGGVYDNGGTASIGSPESTSGGADTDASTTAGSNTTSASTTAADPTTNADSTASTTASTTMPDDGSTGATVTETGDTESTGSGDSAPLDTGDPTESTGPATEDTGIPPKDPPYYDDCTMQSDCGVDGVCFMTGVMNAPDAHVCLVPCGDGCPDPDDAIAMPLCTMQNYCMLSCDIHEDCPMDMYCYTFANDVRRCLWSQG